MLIAFSSFVSFPAHADHPPYFEWNCTFGWEGAGGYGETLIGETVSSEGVCVGTILEAIKNLPNRFSPPIPFKLNYVRKVGVEGPGCFIAGETMICGTQYFWDALPPPESIVRFAAGGAILYRPVSAPEPDKRPCPTESSPDKDGSPDPGSSSARGNPCDAATGNKFQTESDETSATGGIPILRTYNSRLGGDVGFGFGWTSSIQDTRLAVYKTKTGTTTAEVIAANGHGETFTCNGSTCQGDADTHLTLTQDSSGYTLTFNQVGSVKRYDVSGLLLYQTDRSGRTISYAYDSLARVTGITGPFGHSISVGYGADNHVSNITDSAGQIITYRYDSNRNLIGVSYPDGSGKIYYYENVAFPHHLTGIAYVDSNGVTMRYGTYAYDNTGKAILTEHTGGMGRFGFNYNSDTQTTVTDAANNAEVMTFQSNLGVKQLVSRINQADGKSLNQVFDIQNNLVCKKDDEGKVTTYTYNATNQKLSMTEGLSGSCASSQTTNATRTTTYQYASTTLDLPTRISSPSVAPGQTKSTTMQYSDAAHPNLPTRVTQSGYTPSGSAVSRVMNLTYDSTTGQVASITGPRTDVSQATTMTYNTCMSGGGCGQLQRITNALGHVTTFDSYDPNGRLLQKTDPNGLQTVYAYDARGRVASITQNPPVGEARFTTYTYDAAGKVLFAAFPDGRQLAYTYDAAKMLRQVTDNLGNQVRYNYDLKGNRTQEYTYDPSGTLVRQIDYAFDLRNYVSQINAAGSLSQQIHDAIGNLTSQIDPKNNPPSANSYDALNRLIQSINGLGGVTTYAYDPNGRPTQVSAPNGATTRYVYDDLGNLLQEISADRGTTTYTYDAAGNVASQTDARGVTAAYTYDALNRVTSIRYGTGGLSGLLAGLFGPSPDDVTFSYDQGSTTPTTTVCSFGIGRLCKVTDASGMSQYAYDAFGNIAAEVHAILNIAYTTAYTYDAADRLLSITYPDGQVVRYARDGLGRIESVVANNGITLASTPLFAPTVFAALIGGGGSANTIVSNRTYRADGVLTNQTFGNGLNEIRQYDLQGRLINQFVGSADTRVYGYDANGNLTNAQSLPQIGAYTYDAIDRLIRESLTNTTTDTNAYTYDPNGNRSSDLNNNGKTRPYTYTAGTNRLTRMGAQTVTLDAMGNTVSDRGGSRTFTYNNAGQLAQVVIGGVIKGDYVYNYRGQRVIKAKNNQTFVYHYDIHGNLIAETKLDGSLLRDYIWADNEPIAQIQYHGKKPAKITYLHTDHLGAPRLGTDATQAVQWRWESEAFGTGRPEVDPDADGVNTQVRLRLPGQYADGESGLYYNWHRYYDPKTGRYLQPDRLSIRNHVQRAFARYRSGTQAGFANQPPLELNPFVYVANNPLRWTDPTGEIINWPKPALDAAKAFCLAVGLCQGPNIDPAGPSEGDRPPDPNPPAVQTTDQPLDSKGGGKKNGGNDDPPSSGNDSQCRSVPNNLPNNWWIPLIPFLIPVFAP